MYDIKVAKTSPFEFQILKYADLVLVQVPHRIWDLGSGIWDLGPGINTNPLRSIF